MQDRVSLYPGRVKLEPVAGQANLYDLTRADQPTQEGTPLNKASLLKDATASLLGLGTSAVPDDAFGVLAKLGWSLIAAYKVAGSVSFTVPVGVTQIGVYIVGAGGSGSVICSIALSANVVAGGGAAGYAKYFVLDVTPGQVINGVVGAGGTVYEYPSSANPRKKDGATGGSTAFAGISVLGGDGGVALEKNGGYFAYGGQGATPIVGSAPSGLSLPRYCSTPTSLTQNTTKQLPCDSQNPFDPTMQTLCAGGYSIFSGAASLEEIAAMVNGEKGGDGKYSTEFMDRNGNDATGNGNGGGAIIYNYNQSAQEVYAGKGSDGMILIYAKGVRAA